MSFLSTLGSSTPLSEAVLAEHVWPLFSQVLQRDTREIYLANHSLGRPLDATAEHLAKGSRLWFEQLDGAWMPWWSEMEDWRAATAALTGAARADCIVPKTSAGQGLRAVLNSYATVPRVLSTDGEFDSIDHILKQYEHRGRAVLTTVPSRADGCYQVDDLIAKLDSIDLVVVSQVFFSTGQVLQELPKLVEAAHEAGAQVLIDVYHGYGVLPLDLATLDVDFAIAGSYKYLRGGPGVCWLYVAPEILASGATTLDTGWFAKKDPFTYRRPMPPEFAAGGDGWLESTFNPLGFYQARAGLALAGELGVARLRAYSLQQKGFLSRLLSERGITHFGADAQYGAFLTIPHAQPKALAEQLQEAGVNGDARSAGLRLCPDILNTEAQMITAADSLARLLA
ncbi:aminotransferase class V-fold PLP-dependent enzyme [Chitinimonas sp.]|uniref:aminotransferase class V-fold PLP-dependent enzyme n=1 Tax=Chitinimonas sp. TaxID=1934313 RepID=UPI002F956495